MEEKSNFVFFGFTVHGACILRQKRGCGGEGERKNK